MSRERRIFKEFESIKADASSGVTLEIIDEANMSHLKGTFRGPPGTPYEGGVFQVDINLPPEYPFKPPKMKFDTKVYHPNVSSQTGAICLDILKDTWTPILTLRSCLISLQSLLQSPEPNDPQDAEVANHYRKDYKGFAETARYWTQHYAQPAGTPVAPGSQGSSAAPVQLENLYGIDPQLVAKFTDMGFTKEQVVDVLRWLGIKKWSSEQDENRILEKLLAE
ncbi:uncharacterized protein SAPINGB_P002285 [Magnusiomyces paraingens]|uniref:Ubiquitin-conjugating enzyme E2 1 n=1 Tax=Magnusiomyces paraingens TaxID=2606893 RepID=A0A5E8BDS3_9ASCO|nr:uncharacterized protein SAPINGB_P002285 [Saprochaete ingens]VVT49469.1 unnamed protein product [Saprochaete ingens]